MSCLDHVLGISPLTHPPICTHVYVYVHARDRLLEASDIKAKYHKLRALAADFVYAAEVSSLPHIACISPIYLSFISASYFTFHYPLSTLYSLLSPPLFRFFTALLSICVPPDMCLYSMLLQTYGRIIISGMSPCHYFLSLVPPTIGQSQCYSGVDYPCTVCDCTCAVTVPMYSL